MSDDPLPASNVHATRALVGLVVAMLGAMFAVHFVHFDGPSGPAEAASSKPEQSSEAGATSVRDPTRLRLLDEGKGASGRVVFVSRATGELRSETKTGADGFATFSIEDGDSVTVAYGTSRYELVTYLDVTSGETLLAGDIEDEEKEAEETSAVARFLVEPPTPLPAGTARIALTMGSGDLDLPLGKGRELAIPRNRVEAKTYFVVARALDKNGDELGVAVVKREVKDSSKLMLPAFERATEAFTVRLSSAVAKGEVAVSFMWNEGHFERPKATCEGGTCRITCTPSMIALGLTSSPRVRLEIEEKEREMELQESFADARTEVTLNVPADAPDLLARIQEPHWTPAGGIEWPSAFPRTLSVVDVAWPRETKAHTWRFIAASDRRDVPPIQLPPSLAENRLDRANASLGVEAFVAPHLYDARFVRERSLEVLEELPRGGRMLELRAGEMSEP